MLPYIHMYIYIYIYLYYTYHTKRIIPLEALGFHLRPLRGALGSVDRLSRISFDGGRHGRRGPTPNSAILAV